MSKALIGKVKRIATVKRVFLTVGLTLAATVLLLLALGPSFEAHGRVLQGDTAVVYIDPADQTVPRCGTFAVAVAVRDLPENVTGYQFKMGFDPEVVTVTNVTDERFGGGLIPLPPTIEEGSVEFFSFTAGAGSDVDGPLATIEMEVVGLGSSDLVLSDVLLANDDAQEIPSTLEQGAVETVKEAAAFEFETIGDQVAGEPFDVTVTAVNEDGTRAVAFDGPADLTDTTGTLVPDLVVFNDGEASATMTITEAAMDVTITADGTNACGVAVTGESNAFDVEHGEAVDVELTPESATVTTGESISYTLTAYDALGNPWEVTAQSVFSTTDPLGGFVDHVYTAGEIGDWTQTAAYDGLTDTTGVTVEHGEAVRIELTPEDAIVEVGGTVSYTVTAYDAEDNAWEVTAQSAFSTTDPLGGFVDHVYTAGEIGDWTQTATYDGLMDTTGVTVEGTELVRIELTPEDATVVADELIPYTVTAYDAEDNAWDVTAHSVFTTTDPLGAFVDHVYTAGQVGDWVQTAMYDGLTDSTGVTVVAGEAVRIELAPENATVMVGDTLAYTVTAYDAENNAWEVTAESVFTTTDPMGVFVDHAYTAGKVGNWVQTAAYDGLTDSTGVTVEPHTIFLPFIAKSHTP